MRDADLDRLIGKGANQAVAYQPIEVVELQPFSVMIVDHPAGCALQLALTNGRLYRLPMDWSAFQTLRQVVGDYRFSNPVRPAATAGEDSAA